ncbi:hypothetical protein K431DRAFT_284386 [Polychaeton citri CBS 116435]|uniref:ATP synthase subunit K, mitochondrial n=1 Tax=Polychaeton citri CBS 116435 TaxID=1314669 RepID=A0A9P4QC35_9PEZI|nr:hypothetical protein K431DRAFT_284386 [Polychaeton citri CBS 116435]
MVVYYDIAGRKVGSHILAIGVLSALFTGGFAFAGGSKKPATHTPPINASSKDEENFIQEFLKSADGENKEGAKH